MSDKNPDEIIVKGTTPGFGRKLIIAIISFFKFFFLFLCLMIYGNMLLQILSPGELRQIIPHTDRATAYYYELAGAYYIPPIFILLFFFIYKILKWISQKLKPVPVPDISLSRPFILYLRCFDDDQKTSSAVDFLFSSGSTEEEITTEVLSDIAPVVAIGDPRDKKIPKGAARFYVAEDRWKDQVISMLDKAKLVVLRLGETENFWWEVMTSLQKCPKEKLVFLIPQMKNFNMALKLFDSFQKFGITIPENLNLTIDKTPKGTISSLVYFLDGKLICETMKISRWTAIFISFQNMLKKSFQPLMVSFGFKKQQYNFVKISNIIFLSLIISIILWLSMIHIKIDNIIQDSYRTTGNQIVEEFYNNCIKNSKKFTELVKNKNTNEKYTFLFKNLEKGINKLGDAEFYYLSHIINEVKYSGAPELSYFHILCRSKLQFDKNVYSTLLAIYISSVLYSIENMPDRAMIAEAEVKKELELFAMAYTEDSSFTEEQQYRNLINALDKVNEAGLNKYKLFRYSYQQQHKLLQKQNQQ